ncbi:hypothetical protein DKX15_18000, partial [Enterococcus faecium]
GGWGSSSVSLGGCAAAQRQPRMAPLVFTLGDLGIDDLAVALDQLVPGHPELREHLVVRWPAVRGPTAHERDDVVSDPVRHLALGHQEP